MRSVRSGLALLLLTLTLFVALGGLAPALDSLLTPASGPSVVIVDDEAGAALKPASTVAEALAARYSPGAAADAGVDISACSWAANYCYVEVCDNNSGQNTSYWYLRYSWQQYSSESLGQGQYHGVNECKWYVKYVEYNRQAYQFTIYGSQVWIRDVQVGW